MSFKAERIGSQQHALHFLRIALSKVRIIPHLILNLQLRVGFDNHQSLKQLSQLHSQMQTCRGPRCPSSYSQRTHSIQREASPSLSTLEDIDLYSCWYAMKDIIDQTNREQKWNLCIGRAHTFNVGNQKLYDCSCFTMVWQHSSDHRQSLTPIMDALLQQLADGLCSVAYVTWCGVQVRGRSYLLNGMQQEPVQQPVTLHPRISQEQESHM